MDRSRKRKADEPQDGGSATKRQKPSLDTPEAVTKEGLRLVESMKNAKDKTGRSITGLFLTLPDKDDLPEYFDLIKLPIAIDTVERKLRKNAYNSLTEVESDFKRMVANAKAFNDDKSEVFADAERVRKLLFNWMKVNNPAYQNKDYVAFATPIPGEKSGVRRLTVNGSGTPDVQVKEEEPRKKPTITLTSKGRRASEIQPSPVAAATPTPRQASGANEFEGKSFGQVQEAIIEEMIQHRDADDELQIYLPFVNLPSRSLTDYYQLIKRPVSLKSVAKRTRGQHGRDAPTGITDFKTWDAFEEDVSFIWRNAQAYNEDGSEMYNLAAEFEDHFKKRLAEVKTKVDEPQGTRIKLNAKPKTVLHLGARSTQKESSSPGVTVDNEALERQKKMVQAGINGQQTPQPLARTTSLAPAESRDKSTPPVVKTEKSVPSPVNGDVRPSSAAPEIKPSPAPMSMPPPARLPSGSPLPPTQAPVSSMYVPMLGPATATFIDTYSRNRSVSEALLPTIQLSTHPQINVSKAFKMEIPASPDYTQQSVTVLLPPSQYYLQVAPTVSQQLSSGRQYKLFVTVNTVRLSPSMRPLVNGELTNGVEKKQVYDVQLQPGVNRIEVEIVAVTGRGGSLEMEKTTVFANLMRH